MRLIIILTVVLFVSMSLKIDTCEGYRILGIFPMPVRSHFMMLEALMKGLARNGHQVDVVSSLPQNKPYPNYTDIVVEIEPMVNRLTYDHFALWSHKMITTVVEDFGNKLCHLMEQPNMAQLIKNPPKDPPYDLVITEILSAHCFMGFGRHLKVPVIGVSTAALYSWYSGLVGNPANLAFVPNNFINYVPPLSFWQRVHNTVLTIFQFIYYNIYTTPQSAVMKKHFGDDAPTVRDVERDLALVLMNTHPSLNGPRPLTPAVVEVGGLHVQNDTDELPRDLVKWMDDSTAGFIFFTFGSMMQIESFPEKTVLAFYKSLAKISPMRVLMKVSWPEKLLPGTPKNFRIFSWISQDKVLNHKNVKAFITHAGLMGVQEAIYAAVPMLAIPLFADQYTNAALLASKKLAILVEYKDVSEKALDNALSEVLYNPVYKNAMLDMSVKYSDRPMSPLDTAVWWVEYVIRHNGTGLRSPAMDLTWWQIELFDVYAVLLLIALCTILVTIHLIKFSIKFFSKILFTNTSNKVQLVKKVQ